MNNIELLFAVCNPQGLMDLKQGVQISDQSSMAMFVFTEVKLFPSVQHEVIKCNDSFN